ncbi:MAG: insulinase family protein [Myxococcales bacterium]|nr:insulinase family protein [Myxococcales bacterium]
MSLSLVGALWIGDALARPTKPDLALRQTDNTAKVLDLCFPSGLRVLAQTDTSRPLVAIRTLHTHRPTRGKEGVGHLAEHLWFHTQVGRHTVQAHHDRLGVVSNGQTAADWMGFDVEAPAQALNSVLKLETMRMVMPLRGVDEAMMEHEKQVLENERVWRRPLGNVPHVARAALPPDDPLAQITESTESVATIGLSDLASYVRRHWRPSQTTMVVVGDVDVSTLGDVIREVVPHSLLVDPSRPDRTEGRCARRLPPERTHLPPDPQTTDTLEVQAPVEEPVVQVAWTLPGSYRRDHYSLAFAATLLQSLLSRQVGEMPTEDGLSNATRCTLQPRPDTSLLSCTISVDTRRRPQRALAAVRQALGDMSTLDLDFLVHRGMNTFYASKRRQIEGGFGNGSLISRAHDMAQHVHVTGSGTPTMDRLSWLSHMDPDRVARMLRGWITKKRMASVVLLPNGAYGASWSGERTSTLAGAERPAPPDPDTARLASLIASPDLARHRAHTLENGLTIVAIQTPGAPMARTGLLLPGGHFATPGSALARSSWRTTELFYRQGRFSNHRAPATFLGSWRARLDGMGVEVSLSGGSGNLDGQLYLLRDMVDRVSLDLSKRRPSRQWEERYQEYLTERPWLTLHEAAQRSIHPGLHVSWHDADAYRAVRGKEIRAWHEAQWRPSNAILLVVGPTDPERVTNVASSWFSDWKDRSDESLPSVATPATGAGQDEVLLAPNPTTSVAQVRLLCPTEQGPAGQVLRALLQERTWAALRDEAGVAYGAWAFTQPAGTEASLTLSTLANPVEVPLVLDTWTQILKEVSEGVDATDLAYAKLNAANRLRRQYDGRDATFATASWVLRSGGSLKQLADEPKALAAVRAEQVAALAADCAKAHTRTASGPEALYSALSEASVSVTVHSGP